MDFVGRLAVGLDMTDPIPDFEIIGAARAMIDANGFAVAKTKADEMIGCWHGSTAADAKEILEMWERIRAAIVTMEALVV